VKAKATPSTDAYDVIIVGAGPVGAIIALQLARAGKRALLLEAGKGTRDDEEGWQSAVDTFYNAVAKVPNSPYPATAMAPQPDVLQFNQIKPGVPDSAGYWVQHGPQPFASDYTRAKGGTTLHWLGITLRMLPNDFKMKSVYGVGDDWPIGYEDLRKYYEQAENEMGVAGNATEQILPDIDNKSYWGDYVLPMTKLPDSTFAKDLASRIKGMEIPVLGRNYKPWITPTPQGRNSMPNPDYRDPFTGERGNYKPVGTPSNPLRGERCQGNASCVPICPVQAKYSALRTLNRVANITTPSGPRVTVKNQSVVSRIVTNNANGQVDHIEYFAYETGGGPPTLMTAKAKTYVVCAHSVETAKLLLVSGVANSSDQLGRNLMDHPTMLTWGLSEKPVWPFRGPGQTNAIPTWRDGPFRSEMAAFVVPLDNWGWVWSAFSPGAPFAALLNGNGADQKGLFGKQLRQRVAHDFSRQVAFQWEFEQVGRSYNRVTIDRNFLDPLGIPRPVIHYKIDEYLLKAFAAAKDISDRIFAKAKIKDCTNYQRTAPGYVEYNGKGYEYKGCGHLVGTHRMGSSSCDSVTDSWMRSWDHQNLYVVGCGSMPTFGTSNPSLTMAALAFRAAESIIRDLNQEGTVQL
jgi:choline dehydrogenase-like flavoprotein